MRVPADGVKRDVQPAHSLRCPPSFPAQGVTEQRRRAAPELVRALQVLPRLTWMMAPNRPQADPDELRWYGPFSARCQPGRCRAYAEAATAPPRSAGRAAALRATPAFRSARVRSRVR